MNCFAPSSSRRLGWRNVLVPKALSRTEGAFQLEGAKLTKNTKKA
jgi:hypothetical protein